MTARLIAAAAPGAVDAAVAVLESRAVVAIPTETVYGLAVLPERAALEALIVAKQRSADKGIALLIDSLAQAETLVHVPVTARRLAQRFWPGALTLVLPIADGISVDDLLTGGRPTLALRLPDHPVPRALARRLGPIAVSSANVSGEPDATSPEAVMSALADVVELVVDDGPVRGGVPSTVVAVLTSENGIDRLQVLRAGALSEQAIRSSLG